MIKDGLKNPSKVFHIIRNFGFLTMGKTLGDAFTFILFVFLTRTFGQEGIGQYSFAMALTGFFAIFADFGLYNFSIKEMSRCTESLGEYYGKVFSVRLILSCAVLSMLLLFLTFLPYPRETKLIIILIGAYQVIYTMVDGFAAVFIAREDMHLAAFIEFTLRAVTALVGIVAILAGLRLAFVLAILPAITLGVFFVAYGMVANKYGRLRLNISLSNFKENLREAVPYALFVFLRQLSTRADIVLLGFFLGAVAAGVYNVAYRLVFLIMFLSYFAGLSLFPVVSKLYLHSRTELRALYQNSLNIVTLVGLPIAAGLWLIAPNLIRLIYGEGFDESALILRCLSWLIFLAFLKSIMGIFLTSCDRQVDRTKCQWTAAWVNVLGNVILINTIGILGAAIAMLISEALIVILFSIRLKPVLGWPRIGSRLSMSFIATISFCLPFVFLSSQSIIITIPAAALIYLGILALFGDIRKNEFRKLVSSLQG